MKTKAFVLICAMLLAVSGCAAFRSPLVKAAAKGDVKTAQQLIKSGADINEKDRYGYTPLLWAVYSNQLEAVKTFIQMGADIESQDVSGSTPLTLAASYNYSDIAELLVKNHANVNAKDINGQTPLCYAVMYGNESLMKILIDSGADVSVKDKNGQTLLQYALVYRQIDAVALLRRTNQGSTEIKVSSFEDALRAPSRFTPLEGAYLIPEGKENAYAIAISDCNDILIPHKTGLLYALGPVAYAASLVGDMNTIKEEFPKCMEKMGFKCIKDCSKYKGDDKLAEDIMK